MSYSNSNLLAAALVGLASHVAAQVASICPSDDVCFKLNIPESTASSGNGDIFFQLSAPDTYEYVALGQGSSMSGSNIFVVYTSGDGNVTLSPRLGAGHRMPEFNGDAEVTLLEGSGVANGRMTANVRCSSCNNWSGGSASFSGDSGNWIYAVQPSGGPKDSTSQSESINQHNDRGAFQWSYANAKGGNDVNPLFDAGGSGSGTANGGGSRTSCVPRPARTGTATGGAAGTTSTKSEDDNDDGRGRPTDFTWGLSWPTARPTGRPWEDNDKREEKRQEVNYCEESDPSNDGFIPLTGADEFGKTRKMLIAHGTLAALAFVVFFPFGAIAIRLASFTGIVWFHAAFQMFGYIVYLAAVGLGIYIANEYDLLSETHPIIGIVVFAALFFQPILGFVHHAMFKKYQARTAWSHMHLWLGRVAITLGIINGGFGFKLADDMNLSSKAGMIAYGVVAGIVWLVWVAAIVMGERRRRMVARNAPPKNGQSPGVNGELTGERRS